MHSAELILGLVVLATVVGALATRLRVPAPSLLVVAGLAVGLIPGVPDVRLDPDLVSLLVLPPLIFAAGAQLRWAELRPLAGPVTILSFGLVAASAAAIAVVVFALTPLPAVPAVVLGAVLASTDPVAVTALSRRLSLPTRVRTLVQSESLFNDATSLVLFRVSLGVAVAGGTVDWGKAVGQFLLLAFAGGAVGAVAGLATGYLQQRVKDPVMEAVLLLITPYAAYVLGEVAHGSGVTAVVVASVVLGNRPALAARPESGAVYETTVFVLESVVFSLIGLQVPTLVRDLPQGERLWPLVALALTATLLAVRGLWVLALSLRHHPHGAHPPGRLAVVAVVSWAGARGVVPLAAALSIPATVHSGKPFSQRPLLSLLATSVIVLTLVVQGFTLAPLVRRMGLEAAPLEEGPADGVDDDGGH